MRARSWLLGGVLLAVGVTACTAILGDYEVGGGLADGGLCPPGQIADGSGHCVAECKADLCGPHGRCETGASGIACKCDVGYDGAKCEQCAAGYQDKSPNKECKPNCATANLGCPAKSKCDDSSGIATCVCPIGYRLESLAGSTDGGADAAPAAVDGGTRGCVWRGGPQDPGFQNQPVAWRLDAGIPADAGIGDAAYTFAIDPTADGGFDPGVLNVTRNLACTFGARPTASQDIEMPTPAESEPFALRTYVNQISPEVRIGSARYDQLAPGTPLCLGEHAYSGKKNVSITALAGYVPCYHMAPSGVIDHLSIIPEGTCPAVGQFFNGDFDGAGGWNPSVSSGATAEITANVGNNNSRAARLTATATCQSATMTGLASAPSTSIPNPAITFTMKGTNNSTFEFKMVPNGNSGAYVDHLYSLSGNGTYQSFKMCVPEFAKGYVNSAQLVMPQEPNCTNASAAREFIIDDIKFIDDPTCPKPAYVINGDFETRTGPQPWKFFSTPANGSGGGLTTGGAHGGLGLAYLYSSQYCYGATMQQYVTVPPANGPNGAAIKFYYKTNGTLATFSGPTGVALAANANWTEKIVCLSGSRAGQPFAASFSMYSSSGTCATNYSTNYLYIDDVIATTDPSCPAL